MLALSSSELLLYTAAAAITLPILIWLGIHLAIAISTWYAFRDPHGDARATTQILCRNCKYDLRGSPTICPECGTKPTKMQTTFVRYLMRIDKLDELESKRKLQQKR